MTEAIGGLSTTQIPILSDNADIQEALRVYHYGAPTGTGVGEYDSTNTNPANLINPSMAYSLWYLQYQISTLSGTLGIQSSVYTTKGDLLTATGASAITRIGVGANGYVLTANSATSTGLAWAVPEVTATNTLTFTGKSFTAPKITSGSYIADDNGNELIIFPALVTSAVNEVTVSNAATGGKPSVAASGGDTNISLNLIPKGTGTVQAAGVDVVTTSAAQTLSNKTLSSPVINAPTVTQLYLSDSVIVFEGTTADAFETTVTVTDPTADRTWTIPDTDDTFVGKNTSDILKNKVLVSPKERVTVSATAATGVINFDAITQAVLYYTTNASGNFTLNVRGDGSTTLNAFMANTDALSITFLVTNGTTAYYPTAFQIDGTPITPKVQGGSAIVAGNASSVDAYTLTIFKTGSATYSALVAQTRFA